MNLFTFFIYFHSLIKNHKTNNKIIYATARIPKTDNDEIFRQRRNQVFQQNRLNRKLFQ